PPPYHYPHPIPTRRSSDLERAQQREGRVQRRHGGSQVIADVQHLGVVMAELSHQHLGVERVEHVSDQWDGLEVVPLGIIRVGGQDRKSTRLNSSHRTISYA